MKWNVIIRWCNVDNMTLIEYSVTGVMQISLLLRHKFILLCWLGNVLLIELISFVKDLYGVNRSPLCWIYASRGTILSLFVHCCLHVKLGRWDETEKPNPNSLGELKDPENLSQMPEGWHCNDTWHVTVLSSVPGW